MPIKLKSPPIKDEYNARVKAIDSELDAERFRLNTIIAGINEEIKKRRELREDENHEDKIERARKALEAVQAEAEFERDDFTKENLEQEIIRRSQELDKLIQERDDTIFYRNKESEKAGIQEQIKDIETAAKNAKDAAKQQMEAALTFAEVVYVTIPPLPRFGSAATDNDFIGGTTSFGRYLSADGGNRLPTAPEARGAVDILIPGQRGSRSASAVIAPHSSYWGTGGLLQTSTPLTANREFPALAGTLAYALEKGLNFVMYATGTSFQKWPLDLEQATTVNLQGADLPGAYQRCYYNANYVYYCTGTNIRIYDVNTGAFIANRAITSNVSVTVAGSTATVTEIISGSLTMSYNSVTGQVAVCAAVSRVVANTAIHTVAAPNGGAYIGVYRIITNETITTTVITGADKAAENIANNNNGNRITDIRFVSTQGSQSGPTAGYWTFTYEEYTYSNPAVTVIGSAGYIMSFTESKRTATGRHPASGDIPYGSPAPSLSTIVRSTLSALSGAVNTTGANAKRAQILGNLQSESQVDTTAWTSFTDNSGFLLDTVAYSVNAVGNAVVSQSGIRSGVVMRDMNTFAALAATVFRVRLAAGGETTQNLSHNLGTTRIITYQGNICRIANILSGNSGVVIEVDLSSRSFSIRGISSFKRAANPYGVNAYQGGVVDNPAGGGVCYIEAITPRVIEEVPRPPTPKPLELMTVAEIKAVMDAGLHREYFRVGDTKTILLLEGTIITAMIYGFDHDDLLTGGKVPISWGLRFGYGAARRMHSTAINHTAGAVPINECYAWLNSEMYNYLPLEWRSIMGIAVKRTSAGNTGVPALNDNTTNLFMFSEKEIFGDNANSLSGEGSQYPIFTNAASRVRLGNNGAADAGIWFTRSPALNNAANFVTVTAAGVVGTQSALSTAAAGVIFGFVTK